MENIALYHATSLPTTVVLVDPFPYMIAKAL